MQSPYHNPQVAHVHRIDLYVSDLVRSEQFYTKMLGLMVLDRTVDTLSLGVMDQTLVHLIKQENIVLLKAPPSLYHMAFLLPTRSALAQIVRHLVLNDISLQGASDHVVSHAIYLSDPDGYGIELAVDTEPNTWPWKDNQLDLFNLNGPLNLSSLLREAPPEHFMRMPEETLLGHIHLHALDLDKSRWFYTEILKMDVVIDMKNSALFLSYDSYHHHIALNRWQHLQKRDSSPLQSRLRAYLTVSLDLFKIIQSELLAHNIPHQMKDEAIQVIDPNDIEYWISP